MWMAELSSCDPKFEEWKFKKSVITFEQFQHFPALLMQPNRVSQ